MRLAPDNCYRCLKPRPRRTMTNHPSEDFDEMSFYAMSSVGEPIESNGPANIIMDDSGKVIIGTSPHQIIFDRGSIIIENTNWRVQHVMASSTEAMFRAILKLGGNDAINND